MIMLLIVMDSGVVVCCAYGNLLRWEHSSSVPEVNSVGRKNAWYTTRTPYQYRTLIKMAARADIRTNPKSKKWCPMMTIRCDVSPTSQHGAEYLSWIEYSFYRPTPSAELYVQISVVIRGEEHSRSCYYITARKFVGVLRTLI